MKINKSTKILKWRSVSADELPFVLMQMYTPDEAAGIIDTVNETGQYNDNPGYTIIYSCNNQNYIIFVSMYKYLKLVEDIGMRFCVPPRTMKNELKKIKLLNGEFISDSDAEFIMNCKTWCARHPNKKDSVNFLIVDLVKTLLQNQKSLNARIKLKDPVNTEELEKTLEKEYNEIIRKDDGDEAN